MNVLIYKNKMVEQTNQARICDCEKDCGLCYCIKPYSYEKEKIKNK